MSDGHGHETMGTLPSDFPTQAPDRPHRHSHRNDGDRADRRISHRAFRSALTCASPHARTHAREVVVMVLAVPPLPSRCASWRAVRRTSVYLMSAHAPRAAATLLVPCHRESHIARAHVSAQVWTSLLLLRMWFAALPGRGSYTGGGARLPRCTRGDG